VPPPPGSRAGSAYTRFIPREELQGFSSWTPGAFGGPGSAARPAARLHRDPPQAQAQARRRRQPTVAGRTRQSAWAEVQAPARPATRTATATAWWRWRASSRASPQQVTGQFGALLRVLRTASFDALEAHAGQAVARTAVQLARRWCAAELRQHPAIVARWPARRWNAVLLSARQLHVLLHPQDLPLVAAKAPQEALPRAAPACWPTRRSSAAAAGSSPTSVTVDAASRRAGRRPPAAMGHDEPWVRRSRRRERPDL
jgi:flagellar assembly protein FliH